MARQPRAEEFFYLEGGKRQDADLHLPIIAAGDRRRGLRDPLPPIDESVMAPIRKRHRQMWLAERGHKK